MKVILFSESTAQLPAPVLKISLFHGYTFTNILLIMEVTQLPGFSISRTLPQNGSNIFHSLYTILSPKFVRVAQTVTILSQFANVAETASSFMLLSNLEGRIPCKSVYLFFKRQITLSMWILRGAIFHDTCTFFADSCDFSCKCRD